MYGNVRIFRATLHVVTAVVANRRFNILFAPVFQILLVAKTIF